MKAIQITRPGEARVVDVPLPAPRSDEILLRVAACGLCTTDLEILAGDFWGTYPIIPGHEISGVVQRTGDGVAHIAMGERVVIDPNIPCGYCASCRSGSVHLCENLEAIGVTRSGGFAEYVMAPASNVYRLPDSVSDLEGALAEPLACVLHGIDRVGLQSDEIVAVHGAGFIGLLFSVILKHHGVSQILLIDPSTSRQDAAEKQGFSAVSPDDLPVARRRSGATPTLSIVCTGNPSALRSALEHIAPGGRVLLFGVARPTDVAEFVPYQIFRKEVSILGSFVNPFTMQRAVSLLPQLDIRWLISRTFPLEGFTEATRQKERDLAILKTMGVPH